MKIPFPQGYHYMWMPSGKTWSRSVADYIGEAIWYPTIPTNPEKLPTPEGFGNIRRLENLVGEELEVMASSRFLIDTAQAKTPKEIEKIFRNYKRMIHHEDIGRLLGEFTSIAR